MFDAYWADPHFGHTNIIAYCNRPFASTEQMNEALINRYNSHITEEMTVAWLGDCFLTKFEEAKGIMCQLNGRKVLIWGGHDGSFSKMLHIGFSAVTHQMDVRIGDRICTLCHFPYPDTKGPRTAAQRFIESVEEEVRFLKALHNTGKVDTRYEELKYPKRQEQLLVHGHTHSTERINGNGTRIHVGVDAWGYRPVMACEIRSLIENLERIPNVKKCANY